MSILESATGEAYCNNAAERFTPYRTERKHGRLMQWRAKEIKSKKKEKNAKDGKTNKQTPMWIKMNLTTVPSIGRYEKKRK